jgi:DNA polymerase IV
MIVHVDMDAFFASVEQLDQPELKGKCVIVGGTSNRGVVSAASYEARKFGVHSAMPMFQARQKCPHAVFLKPRHKRYSEISSLVMSVLESFSPLVEQVSIDEAFVDISGSESMYGSPSEMGAKIKQKIYDTAHLTCSVGIAPLKFLAKIASDLNKPNGLAYIPPQQVESFIHDLPIRKVPGVGAHTGKQLETLGVYKLGDVRRYTEKQIVDRLGKYGVRLYELSSGIDRSAVHPERPVKSVSSEETLSIDTLDKDRLKKYLLKHAEEVGRELRSQELKATTVTLKIKFSDFTQKSRQIKMDQYTDATEIIYQTASRLLDAFPLNKKVRLIGVGASDFFSADRPVQLSLFPQSKNSRFKWEKLDRAVDAISEKFGRNVIQKAVLKEKD